jgi:hypothetical protein
MRCNPTNQSLGRAMIALVCILALFIFAGSCSYIAEHRAPSCLDQPVTQ